MITLLVTLVLSVSAKRLKFSHFDASSKAGQDLILSSMRVDENHRTLEEAASSDFVADYSIYFDGCHNTTSWSSYGYQIVSLVRFRLCPTKYVHSGKCFSKRVGEYLTPMETFVDAYMNYRMESIRQKCESMRETCGCNDKDDDCLFTCYNSYSYSDFSWSQCAQQQQGKDDKEERLGECQKLEVKNNNNNKDRFLAQDENSYYIGPYCGTGGNGIFLTLYSDAYCTVAISGAATYYNYITGYEMPYQFKEGTSGMISKGWVACVDDSNGNGNGNDNNKNDKNRKDGTAFQLCEESYASSAKCEANMTSLAYPDTSACAYIAQVKSQSNLSFQMSYGNTMSWPSLVFILSGVAILGAVSLQLRMMKRDNDQSSKSSPLVSEVEMR
jgi:hypothetical protein